MDYGIEGKTALVLGGTRGLGFACAKALSEVGVRVILNGRDPSHGEAVARSLTGAAFVPGDIGNEFDRAELLKSVNRLGAPSIIVTNAGGPQAAPFQETAVATWRQSFETNMIGPLEVVRAFLPAMKTAKFGRILNITSFVVKELYPNMALSNSLRIGLTGAMGSIAREVAQHGITINGLLPGLMDTGALRRVIDDQMTRFKLSEAQVRERFAASVPMQRLGTADDMGGLCAFLASVQASYITGQNICVDGGLARNVI
ncbi:MAG TPA: SDR family oxidoreductase [Burkholderiaceae bacterium]|nr:SDR family oxidoreductase [Burkholderiaceae bacterium]